MLVLDPKQIAILTGVATVIGAITQLLKSQVFNGLDPKYKKALPWISMGLGVIYCVCSGLLAGMPVSDLLVQVVQGLAVGAAPVTAHEALMRDNTPPTS
jgi:hypothetical protein